MSWLALAALGAGHGVNPAMGWLFAVALGMQEGRSRAVWRALPPLALGHALAIGAAALVAAALGRLLPVEMLSWLVGVSLIGCGLWRLARDSHPRGGGMRVGFRDLTLWSFLMATGHGAGLMVLPLLVGDVSAGADLLHAASGGGMGHATHQAPAGAGLWATAAHTAGYLAVTGTLAVLVHGRLGLRMLRRMWVNLDLVWGTALVLTGVLTLVL